MTPRTSFRAKPRADTPLRLMGLVVELARSIASQYPDRYDEFAAMFGRLATGFRGAKPGEDESGAGE